MGIMEHVILARLPKWFGERPGKKKDDPPTPEEEEVKVVRKISLHLIS